MPGGLEAAVRSLHRRWPNGVVPYVISKKFSAEQRRVIAAAIIEYQAHTCIKWIPRKNNEEDYVQFREGKGCSSMVGKIGWKQNIILGPRCFRRGTVMHEMMHALGFFHEQSRPDRDNFVTIVEENIKSGKKHNFKRYTVDEVDDLGTQYDCSSIMHYQDTAFSKSRSELKTIVAKNSDCKDIGQRSGFSPTDIIDLNLLYKCNNMPVAPFSPKPPVTPPPATQGTAAPPWVQGKVIDTSYGGK